MWLARDVFRIHCVLVLSLSAPVVVIAATIFYRGRIHHNILDVNPPRSRQGIIIRRNARISKISD